MLLVSYTGCLQSPRPDNFLLFCLLKVLCFIFCIEIHDLLWMFVIRYKAWVKIFLFPVDNQFSVEHNCLKRFTFLHWTASWHLFKNHLAVLCGSLPSFCSIDTYMYPSVFKYHTLLVSVAIQVFRMDRVIPYTLFFPFEDLILCSTRHPLPQFVLYLE